MNEELLVLNSQMAIMDSQLASLDSALSVANTIKSMIDKGGDTDLVMIYIESFLRVFASTKNSVLDDIQQLHKDIGMHHLKRTHDWGTYGFDKDPT